MLEISWMGQNFSHMPNQLLHMYVEPSSRKRDLNFGLGFQSYPYFVCLSSEGSGKRRLVWAFTALNDIDK